MHTRTLGQGLKVSAIGYGCMGLSQSYLPVPTPAEGIGPARAYIEELLPDVLHGTVQPGRIFDRTIGLE